MLKSFTVQNRPVTAAVDRTPSGRTVALQDEPATSVSVHALPDGSFEVREALETGAVHVRQVALTHTPAGVEVSIGGRVWTFTPAGRQGTAARAPDASGRLCAPMAGLVVDVRISEGETVAAYQPVATIEAMKVMAALEAPFAGTVQKLSVRTGDRVAHGQEIAVITPAEPAS